MRVRRFQSCAFIVLQYGLSRSHRTRLDERDASPTDPELLGRSPAFSPPSPLLFSLLDAGRSRADFLSGVRVALIGRDRPLLLTYFFAEGT